MATGAKWKQPFHQIRRFLAKIWLSFYPQVTIIGITGSQGKTSTVRAIASVLSEKYKTLRTDLNLDTVYNLPITILRLRTGDQKLILEYGVDHQKEMDFHLSLVKPSIGILTGLNPTHSEPKLLGSFAGVIKEKSKLLQILPKDGLAILNFDDSRVVGLKEKTKAKVIGYRLEKKTDFWADQIKVNFQGTSFRLHCQGKKQLIETGLIGRHFIYACLAAAAVGFNQSLNWKEIREGLSKLKPLKGRLSVEKGPLGSILIDDSLRANPASTLAGLQVLNDLPAKGKRIAVLGEMGELGVLAKQEHQKLGERLTKLRIDYLITIGPLQKFTAQSALKNGMKKNQVFWVEDVLGAAEILKKLLKEGDLFYLKGSLLRHLERVILILQGKKMGCQMTNCSFYHQCSDCSYLQTGFSELYSKKD